MEVDDESVTDVTLSDIRMSRGDNVTMGDSTGFLGLLPIPSG